MHASDDEFLADPVGLVVLPVPCLHVPVVVGGVLGGGAGGAGELDVVVRAVLHGAAPGPVGVELGVVVAVDLQLVGGAPVQDHADLVAVDGGAEVGVGLAVVQHARLLVFSLVDVDLADPDLPGRIVLPQAVEAVAEDDQLGVLVDASGVQQDVGFAGVAYFPFFHLPGLSVYVEGDQPDVHVGGRVYAVELTVVVLRVGEAVSLRVSVPVARELFHLVVFRVLVDLRHRAGGMSQEQERQRPYDPCNRCSHVCICFRGLETDVELQLYGLSLAEASVQADRDVVSEEVVRAGQGVELVAGAEGLVDTDGVVLAGVGLGELVPVSHRVVLVEDAGVGHEVAQRVSDHHGHGPFQVTAAEAEVSQGDGLALVIDLGGHVAAVGVAHAGLGGDEEAVGEGVAVAQPSAVDGRHVLAEGGAAQPVVVAEGLLVGEVGGADACPEAEIIPQAVGEAQGDAVHDEAV